MFKVISKWILNKRQYKYISSSYTIINKTFTNQIPDLKTFMKNQAQVTNNDNKDNKNNNINSNINNSNTISEMSIPNNMIDKPKDEKYFFIETFGCQMNENDSEVIATILEKNNFVKTSSPDNADIYLTNTCAIRESAEEKVWNHLKHVKGYKRKNPNLIVGILGCMAERMKEKLLETSKTVDLVVGPDAYRDLPNMISILDNSNYNNKNKHLTSINVQLSLEETYADIIPVRKNALKAFISIMRGCNNMCSFCIVPFTRGRERSRPYSSISDEVKSLRDEGVKDITLLGQNVNSFHDLTSKPLINNKDTNNYDINSKGFKELYKLRNEEGMRFAELLDSIAKIAPEIRFRFTSPHPKNFPEILLDVINNNPNICKQIHLPAQSGNSEILHNMRRLHTREAYLDLVELIRKKIPNVALSSDFIVGFCGETDEQFADTLSLIELVKYDLAFLYQYSMRDKTHAYHNLKDNVSEEVKKKRLIEIIDVFKKNQLIRNKMDIGSYQLVLVEGNGRLPGQLMGRADSYKSCIFENSLIYDRIPEFLESKLKNIGNKAIDVNESMYNNYSVYNNDSNVTKSLINMKEYILVKIHDVSYNSLFATPICKTSIREFNEVFKGNSLISS